MGTRGTFGFRIDGVEKLTYNHYDSYPEGLGDEVVEWVLAACSPNRLAQTMTDVSGIETVDDWMDGLQVKVTPEHRAKVGNKYLDMHVGGGCGIGPGDISYYRLLRKAQPSHGIHNVVDAGVMIKQDDIDHEYAYIVDFDAMVVEFWTCYSGGPTLATRNDMRMVGKYPISEVNKWRKTWKSECFPQEEDEE